MNLQKQLSHKNSHLRINRTVMEKIESFTIKFRHTLSDNKHTVNSFAISTGIIFGFLVGGAMAAHIGNYNCFLPGLAILVVVISCVILAFSCVLSKYPSERIISTLKAYPNNVVTLYLQHAY